MQHLIRFGFVALLLLASGAAHAQFSTLVWSDEFNYSGLPDSTLWNYDVGGNGWGNNELQYYTEKREENARVENGKLIIEARREDYQGKDYTSARLVTRNKGDWTYGRIEVRAKLPSGRGTWPAVWMLPTEWIYGDGSWPDNGEIDIMEHVGYDPGVIHGTIHTHDYNHGDNTQKGEQIEVPTAMDSFHVYTLEWTENELRWFVDDTHYFTFKNEGDGWSSWPFDHPFHLLLNVAVGGNWGGAEGVDPDAFPTKMEVDYVRVYKQPEKLNDIIDGPDSLVPYAGPVHFSTGILNANKHEWQVPEGAEILGDADSNSVQVNWGCTGGQVACRIFLEDDTLEVNHQVGIRPFKIRGPLFFSQDDKPLTFYAPAMHHTAYSWQVPADAEILEGQSSDTLRVDWGETQGIIGLTATSDCGTLEADKKVYNPGMQLPYPDPDQPHVLPGTLQTVHYDYGGEGVAYHDSDTGNNGNGVRQDEDVDTQIQPGNLQNVGWIQDGEWLEYTISADSSYFAEVIVNAASNLSNPGTLHIMVNGEKRLSDIAVPGTGGWENFQTFNAGSMHFTSEDTLLRLETDAGGFNMAEIRFEPMNQSNAVNAPLGNDQAKLKTYPNPATDQLHYHANWDISRLKIYNMQGRLVQSYNTRLQSSGSISVSQLKQGHYVVLFVGPKNKWASKSIQKLH